MSHQRLLGILTRKFYPFLLSLPSQFSKIFIRILSKFSSESSQNSHQNLFRVLIKILPGLSLESFQISHMSPLETLHRILPVNSSESFQISHQKFSWIRFAPVLSSESSQDYHQYHLNILIRIISEF